jgi:serine/threonine-protein kinase RsbW
MAEADRVMTNGKAEPEIITMRMPSRLELLGVLDRVTTSVCERMDFDSDTSSLVAMSVIEAGTNAIQHGHRRDPSLAFDVDFRLFSDRLEITVHDTGQGFDLGSVNGDATAPEHLLDARGRGIFIMRQCMDSVNFEFSESGTVCRLVKHRPASSGRS